MKRTVGELNIKGLSVVS